MSVNFLIGHRGVGKTKLLRRISSYLPHSVCIDLDQEIENQSKQTIASIFEQQGEDYFRKIEVTTLQSILEKHISTDKIIFISLGAGFDLSRLDSIINEKNIIWIRRPTDSDGRIFFDRPLLNTNLSPLEDYLTRFNKREKLYSDYFDESLILPEGLDEESEYEKSFFSNTVNVDGASITLLPHHFKNFKAWVTRRIKWNFKFFELRTDLLSEVQIREALSLIPSENILLSIRGLEYKKLNLDMSRFTIDWALELGEPPFKTQYVSSHFFENSLSEHLNFLNKRTEHIKLACEIKSFDDLLIGHEWFMENTQIRSFLPQGPMGTWYRLFIKGQAVINFIREDNGSSLDQPTLMQWLSTPPHTKEFYAVLGNPIHHSYSPVVHSELKPFFQIKLDKLNWASGINALIKLDLKAAAVTAPLKELAFSFAHSNTASSLKVKAANTLAIDHGKIFAHNTDLLALKQCLEKFKDFKQIAIWGGGGVLTSIQECLPQAVSFSASQGTSRHDFDGKSFHPKIVIWAASNSNSVQMPPENWNPEHIFDLNYTSSSLGREYALKTGAQYTSGLEMFFKQAAEQKVFWSNHERQ